MAQTQDVPVPQGQPVFSCGRAKAAQTWSWCERGKRQHTCRYALAYVRACVLAFLQDCVMTSVQPLGPAHSSPIMLRSSCKEDPGKGWDLALRPPAWPYFLSHLICHWELPGWESRNTNEIEQLSACLSFSQPACLLLLLCWLKPQLSAICCKSPRWVFRKKSSTVRTPTAPEAYSSVISPTSTPTVATRTPNFNFHCPAPTMRFPTTHQLPGLLSLPCSPAQDPTQQLLGALHLLGEGAYGLKANCPSLNLRPLLLFGD